MIIRAALVYATMMLAIPPAVAKDKTTQLVFLLSAKDGCPFAGSAEPDPSWASVKKVKVNGVTRFRHDDMFVEEYPAEVTLRLTFGYADDLSALSKPASVCALHFDPAAIKFKAAWRTGATRIPAHGSILNSERHAPSLMCETSCHEYWTYEMRIESANIPIGHELLLTIYGEDGKVITTLEGGLVQMDSSGKLIARVP